MNKIEFTKEEKLTHYYLINAALMPNMGILNGRMRAIIHFLEISKSQNNTIYEDFAIELLDEIVDEINDDFPICFEYGLCGIGWGIEYIVKKRLLAVDEDVCAPFDKYINKFILHEDYEGIGLKKGLIGVLLYLLSRLENQDLISKKEVVESCKGQIKAVVKIISRMLTKEFVLDLQKEKENQDFDPAGIIIYSKWEYPILLQALFLTHYHDIERIEVKNILTRLLSAIKITAHYPKYANNRNLLVKVVEPINALLKI